MQIINQHTPREREREREVTFTCPKQIRHPTLIFFNSLLNMKVRCNSYSGFFFNKNFRNLEKLKNNKKALNCGWTQSKGPMEECKIIALKRAIGILLRS